MALVVVDMQKAFIADRDEGCPWANLKADGAALAARPSARIRF